MLLPRRLWTWWRHQMEFPTQRPVTRSFDVFFDLRPYKRLSKQLWGWWFETPSCPLWRHCNDFTELYLSMYKSCGSNSSCDLTMWWFLPIETFHMKRQVKLPSGICPNYTRITKCNVYTHMYSIPAILFMILYIPVGHPVMCVINLIGIFVHCPCDYTYRTVHSRPLLVNPYP